MAKTEYGILTKSDNALLAEERGLVTYSRLAAWQKRAVDRFAVVPREWHHTGAAANRTDYYSPADFEHLDPADFPPVKVEKVDQPDVNRVRVTICFNEAVGGFSRNARMKWEERTVSGTPDVRKKDGRITGVEGRRLDSRNEWVRFEYLPPRCRKWRTVTRSELVELGYRFA